MNSKPSEKTAAGYRGYGHESPPIFPKDPEKRLDNDLKQKKLKPKIMAVVIISHTVADFGAWKPYYDADTKRRKEAGLKEIICGQAADNPNSVYMVFETKDLSSIDQMFNDPELAKVMQEAGVTSKPEVVIIK